MIARLIIALCLAATAVTAWHWWRLVIIAVILLFFWVRWRSLNRHVSVTVTRPAMDVTQQAPRADISRVRDTGRAPF